MDIIPDGSDGEQVPKNCHARIRTIYPKGTSIKDGRTKDGRGAVLTAVSYTHLTLPTKA